MAERVGFEPTDAFTSPVFKTGSLNHSDISPCGSDAFDMIANSFGFVNWFPHIFLKKSQKTFLKKF